jgi:hypothetical protein
MPSITHCFAQTLKYLTTYTFQTVDQDGTNTRTFATGASSTAPKYYRFACASASGGATAETDCLELTAAFESLLNTSGSRYSVTISETGYVQVTYNGTGTSTLTWGSSGSNALRSTLGFSSGWSSLASGATTTASNQPSHVVYAFSLGEDTQWTSEPGQETITETQDGCVYGIASGVDLSVRSFTLRFHPRTDSDRGALSSVITPAFPTFARTKTPSASLIAGGPWSVHELIKTALSDGTYSGRLGVCFANFQNLRSGVSTTIDECFIRPETRRSGKRGLPSVQNWSRLVDIKNIALIRNAQLTVSL